MWLPLNLGKSGSLGFSVIDRKDDPYYRNFEIEHRFSVAVMEATVDYQYACLSDTLKFTDDYGIPHDIVHAMTSIQVEGNDLNECIEECKNQIITKKL